MVSAQSSATPSPHFDWTHGVVAILKSSRPVGAGFIVTDQAGQPLILTCAHVLADAGWGFQQWEEPVQLRFNGADGPGRGRALAVAGCYRPVDGDDIAVLRPEGSLPAGVVALPLAPAAGLVNEPVSFFGYPQGHDELRGAGQLLGSVRRGGRRRLQIDSAQVTAGYSGGPVWAAERQQVVGMVLAGTKAPDALGRLPYVAFAAPAEALAEICPDLHLSQRAGQTVYGVPSLPAHFQPRPDDLAALRARLLGEAGAVAIAGKSKAVGVQGMGGIGKSVMAAALARDGAVRAAFPDGIFWLTLGQTPNLLEKQAELGRALGQTDVAFTGPGEGQAALRGWLTGRRCLLVLDDVWELSHAVTLRVLDEAAGARLLLTSRDGGLLRDLSAAVHDLDLLPLAGALVLLAEAAGIETETQTETETAAMREVALACGRLPLALAMIGGMVRGKPEPWALAARYLAKQDLKRIRKRFPDYPYPDLLRALAASVEAMGQEDGLTHLDPVTRYLDLALFPEDVPVPPAVLVTYWADVGLDDLDVEELVEAWVDRSLARVDETGRLTLHDLQGDYVRQQAGDVTAQHERLLAAYGAVCNGDWPAGPEDGYYFDWLTYHLAAAGREEALTDLVWSYDWLMARLLRSGVAGPLVDLGRAITLAPAPTLRRLEQSIRLSASVLNQQREQLAGHLLARLTSLREGDLPQRLGQLTAAVRERTTQPWLRPRWASLAAPGGALETTLAGHTNNVGSVFCLPDGRRALSAAEDGALKMWDLESGVASYSLSGHQAPIKCVAMTADGRRAISAAVDNSLKVWRLDHGALLFDLKDHPEWVDAVAITLDGRQAVSAANDGTLIVWDLDQGTRRAVFTGQRTATVMMVMTPDGRYAVSTARGYALNFWDLEGGFLIGTGAGHSKTVTALVITPDGRRAVSASLDETVAVWDLADGALSLVLAGHKGPVWDVAVTPDGRYAVSAGDDHILKVWDLENGSLRQDLSGHQSRVTGVTIMPDGRQAFSIAADRSLKRWDLDSGDLSYDLQGHPAQMNDVAITPDGRRAVVALADGSLKVWDLTGGGRSGGRGGGRAGHRSKVLAVTIMPGGRHVISAAEDGTYKVWDLSNGHLVRDLAGHSAELLALAVASAGRRAIAADYDHTVKVWDPDRGELLYHLEGHTDRVDAVAVTPAGQWAVSASLDGSLKVWDLATGALSQELVGHTDWIVAVAITPAGRRVVSAARDGTVRVWDVATGRLSHKFRGQTGLNNTVTIAASGRQIIAVSRDYGLTVWDLAKGAHRHTLHGHTNWVNGVAITPDERRAVSVAADRAIKVWDLELGVLVTDFVAEAAVTCVAVAPDGRTIVAGDAGGQVHVLELVLGE